MVLFYWYTMTLFWSPATGAAAKTHLRALIAIKSLYFTFSAMQLRNGYPPPASYRCDITPSCLTVADSICRTLGDQCDVHPQMLCFCAALSHMVITSAWLRLV